MNPAARILLTLTLLLPLAAQAESYRVDLIVFVDKWASAGEAGRHSALPDMSRALELSDSAGLRAADISILPVEQFGLSAQWQSLQNAKRFQPVIRLSWIQKDPPEERAPALHLRWGETSAATGMAPVDGSVSLSAGHYLHLDADLLYTQAVEGGHVSYRLHENRKMRRDELHHLDSPRLGILARVTKATN
jgi:hypothetical protein